MGLKLIEPGLYANDISYAGDDLAKYETLVKYSRMPMGSKKTKRLSAFEDVPGREEAWKATIEFINDQIDPPLLFLYGPPGRSKTHLALAIGWVFLAKLRSVLYYEVVELLDDLRDGYRSQFDYDDPKSHSSIMKRLKNYDLLILDDLGMEKSTDWATERLDHIVNYRFVNDKPTVITANVLDISERILDRCKEGCIVRLEGESYRDIIRKRK